MNQQVARELVKLLGVKNCIEVASLPASENDRTGFERVQLTVDVPLATVAQAMAMARARQIPGGRQDDEEMTETLAADLR